MKKVTLDATDENVLQSIQNKVGDRNARIQEFIQILDSIPGNRFISIDARWGEGKTFFVRQIEKTLEYITLKNFGTEDSENRYQKMASYFADTALRDIELSKSYLPIYYNAWLYDTHTDPLMSLLYVIIKKSGSVVDTKLSTTTGDKIKGILSSIQCGIGIFNGAFNASINGNDVVNNFENKKILDEIQLAEDIREKVKEIFDEVIKERAQKLVIFIDELDRCRPSYALEILERIKHYFDDDRIIFVVSVNKEQLTHTISNYYGSGFDSTAYLNKFFDIEAHLPQLQTYDRDIDTGNREQYFLNSISKSLVRYYKLTMRDFLIYREKIHNLEMCSLINDRSMRGVCASLFVPIIIILDMIDIKEKNKFISGDTKFLEIMKMIPEGKNLYECCGESNLDMNDRVEDGYMKIKAVYDFIFGNLTVEEFRERNIMLIDGFKEKMLSCCGQMSLYI